MCNKEISESETWSSFFLSFVFPLMYLEIRKKSNDFYFFHIGNCQTVIGQDTRNPLHSPPLCCLRHKQIYTSCLIFSPRGKKKKKKKSVLTFYINSLLWKHQLRLHYPMSSNSFTQTGKTECLFSNFLSSTE